MHNARSRYKHAPSTIFGAPASSMRRQQMASVASGLYDPHRLPPVHVTERDYRRLRSLPAAERRTTDETVLSLLSHELDRAIVHLPDKIPADAVTLRSRVVFRPDIDKGPECRALVYDELHAVIGGTVSVLTPLGAALLGLRAGSTMPYRGLDGRLRVVSVEGIAYQPEDQERHLRQTRRPNRYDDDGKREEDPPSRPTPGIEARPVMPEDSDSGPNIQSSMAPAMAPP